MATRSRALRSAHHANLPSRAKHKFAAAVTSPAAKAAFVVIGATGLAALAIAIFGPRRFQREILRPVQSAVGDQASQLWADSRPLRQQLGALFARVQTGSGRDRLVQNFQTWLGHFKAS